MTTPKTIIAIDGPAGSGKSTVARRVARRLGLFYIDTGAMYRALALKILRTGTDPLDTPAVIALAKSVRIRLDYDTETGTLKISLDGNDVSEEIRDPSVTSRVSEIAKIKEVREQMVLMQRQLAEGKKVILEGRDIATVVFPGATKKFFLDADPAERIRRRYLEMKEKNIKIGEAEIQKDIEQRDKMDSTRAHAPLRRAPDAVHIDTTRLTIDEVVARVIEEIHKK